MKLQPIEWDFRTVSEQNLRAVLLWEYCRESEKIRPMLTDFLKSDGAIPKPLLGLGADFLSIAIHGRQDFPAPWLAGKVDPLTLELSTRPIDAFRTIGRGSALYRIYGDPGIPQWMKESERPEYAFRIQFGHCGVDVIVKQFKAWATQEAKRFGRKRGKGASPPWDELKWLAALRLSRESTYKQAQAIIKAHRSKNPVTDGADVLPVYLDKSGWSNACRYARRTLAQIERLMEKK